ncbi:hypothetical protein [Streptomyces sp. NPDC005209]|uniref:hypothetical protein n=1 Tax=Streptomyces sp. NPDC005209 TaxID=3156715 RepID=UPI0033BB59C6
MDIKVAVLWALLGGGVSEAALIFAMMKPSSPKEKWKWPWSKDEMPKFCFGMTCRFFLTGAAVAPLAATKRVPDSLIAFLLGMCAPLLVAKMAAIGDQFISQNLNASPSPTDSSEPLEKDQSSQNKEAGVPNPRSSDSKVGVNDEITGGNNVIE